MATVTAAMLESGSVVHQAKFVDVGGIRTRYYELGSGEAMVLCHGSDFVGEISANTWTRNLRGLGENFHVFAADKLGMGMTDNPDRDDQFTIDAVVDHMYSFMRLKGIEKVHLVGQSRGGYLAARLALEHPEMAKTLVIIDSGTLAPEVGDSSERRAKILANLPTDLKENIWEHWTRVSYTTDHLTEDYIDAAVFMESSPKAQETKRRMKAGCSKIFLESQAQGKEETLRWIREGRLTIPILIFWSADDQTALLEQGFKLFDLVRQHSPRARMHVVNHAGHFGYREYPEDFNRVVTDFIQSNA